MPLLKSVFISIVTDRTVQGGSTTSGLSLWGGLNLSDAYQWLAFYATVVGALGTTAMLVYTTIKIVLLLRNQKSTD